MVKRMKAFESSNNLVVSAVLFISAKGREKLDKTTIPF